MYLEHFGIQQFPFTLTPNTAFYFGLPSHNEALDVLKTAVECGEGFIKVTGEVGAGKSLICRKLLNELSDKYVAAYIPNPYLSPPELRKVVAAELKVDLSYTSDQQEFTHLLQKHLIKTRCENKAALLIIDEAQALPDESIEALRLMTNLETESSKLLQVVLFGQPELNEKLNKPELRQLKQRITFAYELKPMDIEQVHQYLQFRMRTSGHRTGNIFVRAASKALTKFSKGTPRLVNILAHKALMLAYGEGLEQVSKKHIKMAAMDTEAAFVEPPSHAWVAPLAALSLIGVIAIVSILVKAEYSNLLSLVMGWGQ